MPGNNYRDSLTSPPGFDINTYIKPSKIPLCGDIVYLGALVYKITTEDCLAYRGISYNSITSKPPYVVKFTFPGESIKCVAELMGSGGDGRLCPDPFHVRSRININTPTQLDLYICPGTINNFYPSNVAQWSLSVSTTGTHYIGVHATVSANPGSLNVTSASVVTSSTNFTLPEPAVDALPVEITMLIAVVEEGVVYQAAFDNLCFTSAQTLILPLSGTVYYTLTPC